MIGIPWMVDRMSHHPDVFRLIHEFNRLPQNWVHPEHLQTVPEWPIANYLSQTPSGQERAARWIDDHLGLSETTTYWDFEDESKRLALLCWQSLDLIARCTGSLLHAPEITTLIGRDQIVALRNSIGKDAHEFALRARHQVRIPEEVASLMESWVPQTQPDDDAGNHHQASQLGGLAEEHGWNLLRTTLSGRPIPLWRRFHFKIPDRFHTPGIEVAPSAAQRLGCWTLVHTAARQLLSQSELRCFD